MVSSSSSGISSTDCVGGFVIRIAGVLFCAVRDGDWAEEGESG